MMINKFSCLAALMIFLSCLQSSTQQLWKNDKISRQWQPLTGSEFGGPGSGEKQNGQSNNFGPPPKPSGNLPRPPVNNSPILPPPPSPPQRIPSAPQPLPLPPSVPVGPPHVPQPSVPKPAPGNGPVSNFYGQELPAPIHNPGNNYPQPQPEPSFYPRPEPQPHPQPHPEPHPEPVFYPHPEPQPHPQPHPEPVFYPHPEPQPHPQPHPEPVFYPHPEPQPHPQPHPEPVFYPQPQPHPHPQPVPYPQQEIVEIVPVPQHHPYPQPHPVGPIGPQPISAYQQPVLSNTGEIIVETLLAGIPFDCRGRPTGHWRDSKFCDVFHACVYGQQRKTYACPIVGERTYFDDVTKRCEFVTQNSCGNHAFYKK